MNKSASVKFLMWLTDIGERNSILQWLPVILKVKLKILHMTCKPLHDLIPAELTCLISCYSSIHYSFLFPLVLCTPATLVFFYYL